MPYPNALRLSALLLLAIVTTGCGASYATPGGPADMQAFGVSHRIQNLQRDAETDPGVIQSLGKRPLARFPTGVAVARVQQPGYRSYTSEGWGQGQYSVVTTRDIETPAQMERLTKLRMVQGVAPVNRLLLPPQLKSDLELREAAAALHADVLLVYTLDTTFRVEDKAAPLTVLTLGLSPNQKAYVVCTASAVLMDTRNGYIYGVAEATDRQNQLASAWTSDSAVDDVRKRCEAKAFDNLVGELERTWEGVVRIHGNAAPPAPPPTAL